MRKKRHRGYCRRVDKTMIGMIIFVLGISIVAVITLPYKVWIILIACMMIYIGYKLFSG